MWFHDRFQDGAVAFVMDVGKVDKPMCRLVFGEADLSNFEPAGFEQPGISRDYRRAGQQHGGQELAPVEF